MFDKIKSLFGSKQAVETEDLIRSQAKAYNQPLPGEPMVEADQTPVAEVDDDGDN